MHPKNVKKFQLEQYKIKPIKTIAFKYKRVVYTPFKKQIFYFLGIRLTRQVMTSTTDTPPSTGKNFLSVVNIFNYINLLFCGFVGHHHHHEHRPKRQVTASTTTEVPSTGKKFVPVDYIYLKYFNCFIGL